ncbi:hypothetical protein [Polaribacter glomeratus]|nr:hypothetical protein [Polaribacter glomeratus]
MKEKSNSEFSQLKNSTSLPALDNQKKEQLINDKDKQKQIQENQQQ